MRTPISSVLVAPLIVACNSDDGGDKPSLPAPPPQAWTQSYDAGYVDVNGAWAGGSEIMHLATHKGRLYAANGYWEDSRWADFAPGDRQSAQVLRLDSTAAAWQVDLDLGIENDVGAEYIKGNILKSVTFTSDGNGNALATPRNMLVMASGNMSTLVSVWVRDDTTATWTHEVVQSGTAIAGVRWAPREIGRAHV